MARLKSNIVNDVVEFIIKKVNNCEYISGDVVSEVALAETMQVSRTPVREAIMRLIDIGVLERTLTKVVVKPITFDDIKEIIEVREAIELMSVKLITSNGGLTDEQLQKIKLVSETLDDSVVEGDIEQNFKSDFDFHALLVEFSGNKRLIDICERINVQSQRFRWVTLLTPARYVNTAKEHDDIFDALENKDEETTCLAIEKHLRQTLENYKDILEDDKWSRMMQELKVMNIAKN